MGIIHNSYIGRQLSQSDSCPCLVPRRLSLARKGRREGDIGLRLTSPAVCTLPMVPCGSSPVARLYLAKNEAPEEEAVPVQYYILFDIFLLFLVQAIIHVQQLKDDLQKERNRHDQYMKSTSEKMEKERENVRQTCLVEANKLSKKVN